MRDRLDFGVGCATGFESTSHAYRDNDHKGNSPENGICRKFDVWELSSTFGGLRHFRANDHITSSGAQPHICEQSSPFPGRPINVAGRGQME
jgi:hypothetical protein